MLNYYTQATCKTSRHRILVKGIEMLYRQILFPILFHLSTHKQ